MEHSPSDDLLVDFSGDLADKLKAGNVKKVTVAKLNNIKVTGNIHPMLLIRGENFLRKALSSSGEGGTLDGEELVAAFETASSTWLGTGAFKRCIVRVVENGNATNGGPAGVVDVDISLEGADPRLEYGVVPTDGHWQFAAKYGYRNALRGLFSVELSHVPMMTDLETTGVTLVAHATPIVATRSQLSAAARRTVRPAHVHPEEHSNVFEWKINLGNPRSGLNHVVSVAHETRQARCPDAEYLPVVDHRDSRAHTKVSLRHSARFLCGSFAPVGPVGGLDAIWKNEVALRAFGSPNNFLKSELQVMKHLWLSSNVSIDLDFRVGGVAALDSKSRVPVNDRLLLSWRHVRGYNTIGPTTWDGKEPSEVPKLRRATTGGNAVWAVSASLNMPLPLPESDSVPLPWLPFAPTARNFDKDIVNLFAFANAGNLCRFDSFSDVRSRWFETLTRMSGSIGAGIAMTTPPPRDGHSPGRLEASISLPLTFSKDGALTASPNAFKQFRFGVVWSSNAPL